VRSRVRRALDGCPTPGRGWRRIVQKAEALAALVVQEAMASVFCPTGDGIDRPGLVAAGSAEWRALAVSVGTNALLRSWRDNGELAGLVRRLCHRWLALTRRRIAERRHSPTGWTGDSADCR